MEEKNWESASTCEFYLSGRKGEEENVCFLHRIISFFFNGLLTPASFLLCSLSRLFLIKVKGNRGEYPCMKREALSHLRVIKQITFTRVDPKICVK